MKKYNTYNKISYTRKYNRNVKWIVSYFPITDATDKTNLNGKYYPETSIEEIIYNERVLSNVLKRYKTWPDHRKYEKNKKI